MHDNVLIEHGGMDFRTPRTAGPGVTVLPLDGPVAGSFQMPDNCSHHEYGHEFYSPQSGLKFAPPPSRHTPRRGSSGPPGLGVKAMGIPGTGEHDDGTVLGGSVDVSQGPDAGSSHFPCFVLPKKRDRLVPVPVVGLDPVNRV